MKKKMINFFNYIYFKKNIKLKILNKKNSTNKILNINKSINNDIFKSQKFYQ
jgi:hypothetical protein